MTVFALRIACPDRPGSLGAVATALGDAGVNIVSLDVLERSEGVAVDHLVLEADALGFQGLVAVVESVPEVVAELVHTVPQAPRRNGPLGLAADLVDLDVPGDVLRLVTDGVAETFNASWCVALRAREPQPQVLAASPGTPSFVGATLPWLPLHAPRRLRPGPWTPSRWPLDPVSATFAAAPLACDRDVILVARTRGPAFRPRELAELGHLARIARRVGTAYLQPPALGREQP